MIQGGKYAFLYVVLNLTVKTTRSIYRVCSIELLLGRKRHFSVA